MLYNIRRKFQEHVRGLEHTIVDNNFYDLLTNVLFCRSINYGDTYTGRIQLFVSDDEGKCISFSVKIYFLLQFIISHLYYLY